MHRTLQERGFHFRSWTKKENLFFGQIGEWKEEITKGTKDPFGGAWKVETRKSCQVDAGESSTAKNPLKWRCEFWWSTNGFNQEQDRALVELVEMFDGSWIKIAAHLNKRFKTNFSSGKCCEYILFLFLLYPLFFLWQTFSSPTALMGHSSKILPRAESQQEDWHFQPWWLPFQFQASLGLSL